MSTRKKRPMNQTQEGKRDERIGLRLPIGMTERIKRAAQQDTRTVTNWIEKVIRDALEESEKERRG